MPRTYFRSWKEKDFEAVRSVLADDATFRGPMGTADSGDSCIQGMKGMAQSMHDLVIRKVFVDGSDVLTWFDLHMKGAPPCPTANWSHVEDGKIKMIQVTFDPRPLVAPDGR